MALALVAATPADAGKAFIRWDCAGSQCGQLLVFWANPGERNVFTTANSGRALVLRDAGAPITGCPELDGGVHCEPTSDGYGGLQTVHLDDDDDFARADADLDGGPGNDRLEGYGTHSGGPGNDVVIGGERIQDDDGPARGRDVYMQAKELRYDTRKLSVRLDLRPGHPSEDRVSGIPKITGSLVGDVLTGDDGPNQLYGGGGDDRVRGLDGNDTVFGNQVDGGLGDDTVGGGWLGGRLRCGPGRDTAWPAPRGLVSSDCEAVRLGETGGRRVSLNAALRRPGAAIITGLKCSGCAVPNRWRLRTRGRIVGELTTSKRPSDLRLNAEGRALLERRRTLRVQIVRRFIAASNTYRYERFRLELTLR